MVIVTPYHSDCIFEHCHFNKSIQYTSDITEGHLGPEGSVPYIRLPLISEASFRVSSPGLVVYEIAVIIPSFWMDKHQKSE